MSVNIDLLKNAWLNRSCLWRMLPLPSPLPKPTDSKRTGSGQGRSQPRRQGAQTRASHHRGTTNPSQLTPVGWREPLGTSCHRGKRLSLIYGLSSLVCACPPRRAAELQPRSGIAVEGAGEGKSPQWAVSGCASTLCGPRRAWPETGYTRSFQQRRMVY